MGGLQEKAAEAGAAVIPQPPFKAIGIAYARAAARRRRRLLIGYIKSKEEEENV